MSDSATITIRELVAHGFVPEEHRERLQRYLAARNKFLDMFGPIGGFDVGTTLLEVERACGVIAQVIGRLRGRHQLFEQEILSVVRELIPEDKRARELHALTAQLGEILRYASEKAVSDVLSDVLGKAVRVVNEIEDMLREIRSELLGDDRDAR